MGILRFIIPPVILIVAFLTWPQIEFIFASPEEKLEHLWQQDLQTLTDKNKLPKNWEKIRTIEMSINNDQSNYWLKPVKTPIRVNPQGTYKLEILLLPWINEGEYGIVINYHLIDKDNNTEWESGRTFVIGSESQVKNRLKNKKSPKGEKEQEKKKQSNHLDANQKTHNG